jgi:hypothetical protein
LPIPEKVIYRNGDGRQGRVEHTFDRPSFVEIMVEVD